MPELLERLSAAMTNDVGHERAVVERREVLYFLHDSWVPMKIVGDLANANFHI